MILTLTPNPALDHTYQLAHLNRGRSNRAAPAAVRAGGKGINVSRVLHQQGHPTLAIAPLGGHGGEQFAANIRANTLPLLAVPVTADTRKSIAIYEQHSNTTTVLNETGSALTAADWNNILRATTHELPRADSLVIAGSLPPQAPAGFYETLVTAARAAGIPTVIDVAGPALRTAARAGADLLKPNGDELAEATGLADPAAGAQQLIAEGAGAVLVSLGEAGMECHTRHGAWRAGLGRTLQGNPTGAGDAAVAAATVGIAEARTAATGDARDAHWPHTLRTAIAWSAAAVLSPLAGELHPSWRALLAEVTVKRIA